MLEADIFGTFYLHLTVSSISFGETPPLISGDCAFVDSPSFVSIDVCVGCVAGGDSDVSGTLLATINIRNDSFNLAVKKPRNRLNSHAKSLSISLVEAFVGRIIVVFTLVARTLSKCLKWLLQFNWQKKTEQYRNLIHIETNFCFFSQLERFTVLVLWKS